MKFFATLSSLILIFFFLIGSCVKEDLPTNNSNSDELIDSIHVSTRIIKAWTDTSFIQIYANDDIEVSWEANHGTILQESASSIVIDSNNSIITSGKKVIYFAGECCTGTNTITYTATLENKIQTDTIKIHVTSYFE